MRGGAKGEEGLRWEGRGKGRRGGAKPGGEGLRQEEGLKREGRG